MSVDRLPASGQTVDTVTAARLKATATAPRRSAGPAPGSRWIRSSQIVAERSSGKQRKGRDRRQRTIVEVAELDQAVEAEAGQRDEGNLVGVKPVAAAPDRKRRRGRRGQVAEADQQPR